MDTSLFYSVDNIFSYNALLYFLIGERGVGKSYSMKRWCINHYIRTKKKFILLRRVKKDTSDSLKNFAKDVGKEYPDDKFTFIEDDKLSYIKMNGEIIGYGMFLRGAENYKGISFEDVDTIMFDEFLVGDGGSRYLKNEVAYLLSIMESVFRLRENVRVVCLGNSTSIINPYFEYFDINFDSSKRIQTFKDGVIYVEYIENKPYREYKKKTKLGTLVAGTPYEEYAIDNKFLLDNYEFILERPQNAYPYFNIRIENNIYGVWLKDYTMYISNVNDMNKITLVFDNQYHDTKTILVNKSSGFLDTIAKKYQSGLLHFDTLKIKDDIINLLLRFNCIK